MFVKIVIGMENVCVWLGSYFSVINSSKYWNYFNLIHDRYCTILPNRWATGLNTLLPGSLVGEGRESWYAFYFLGHQRKTISQTYLSNSANENSKSWALLLIITMAVESMISRVWGCKKRSSSVSTPPPGRESWYAWWGELIRPIYTTVAV